ncbi:MAG: SRPBCC family protein, partial [Sandaracinaceae bacterium]
ALAQARAQAARRPSLGPTERARLAPLAARGLVGAVELRRGGLLSGMVLMTEVRASPSVVASVVGDPAAYPRFMPAVSEVTVTERSAASTAFRWRWRTAVFSFAGRAFLTSYPPPADRPEQGYRIELRRTSGDLGEGREVFRILPHGPGRSLLVHASRMDIRDANYLTRRVVGRNRSINRSVALAIATGTVLRTRLEAERRAGRSPRPAPRRDASSLRAPDVDPRPLLGLLRRSDVLFIEVEGATFVQTAILSRIPKDEARVRTAMLDPEAFTAGLSEATRVVATRRSPDGTAFDWVFDVPLIGSRGSMLLREEGSTIALDGTRGALDGGRWRFRHRGLPDGSTAVLGWAAFDVADGSFLLRAIVNADPAFRPGLSSAMLVMMSRALRIRARSVR